MNLKEGIEKLKGLIEKFNVEPIVTTEQSFTEAKLMDGVTIIQYDAPELAQGVPVNVVTPEGILPMPDGEYVMEDGSKKLDGIIMKNSWVSDASMGIKAPEMFTDLPDGTWYISYKFQDDDMWNEFVKSGNFKGVSVEGMFDLVPYEQTFEQQFLKILNQITQY